jgi:hypothetical protein
MSPLLARLRHAAMSALWSLLRDKRTLRGHRQTVANDPFETCLSLKNCPLLGVDRKSRTDRHDDAFDPATDIRSSYISAPSHQSVNSAHSAAPKSAQTKQSKIRKSKSSRVMVGFRLSVARCSAGPISTGARVSNSCYGEPNDFGFRRYDGLRTLDARNRLI